ncbi:MAG: EipB-like, partial [Methylobacteriaceae bacterium]|nr:EipB-like [Methylobacteriaceae bacterium]
MPSLRVLTLCLFAAGGLSGVACAATNQPAGPVPAAASPDQSPALVSHRAVYELSLAKATGSKSPTAARG